MFKKTLIFLSLLVFLFGLPLSARAVPIIVDFTGEIYTVGASISGAGVSVGDTVFGRFIYDTSATDSNSDPDYGSYTAFVFDIAFSSGFSATSLSTSVTVQNDQQNGSATQPADGMTVLSSSVSGFTLNGRSITGYQFGLRKEIADGDLWYYDYLPNLADWAGVTLADINAPDWHWMQFNMGSDTSIFDSQIRWDITSFRVRSESVPEPGTMFLLGIGMVGLVGAGRKLKK